MVQKPTTQLLPPVHSLPLHNGPQKATSYLGPLQFRKKGGNLHPKALLYTLPTLLLR